MDATPALQTLTEQGTTVPVTRAEMAGGGVLPWRRKRRRGKPLAPALVQVLTGQGEIGNTLLTDGVSEQTLAKGDLHSLPTGRPQCGNNQGSERQTDGVDQRVGSTALPS
jgi:hypothetical protein